MHALAKMLNEISSCFYHKEIKLWKILNSTTVYLRQSKNFDCLEKIVMLHAKSCSIQLYMTTLWGIWVGSPVILALSFYSRKFPAMCKRAEITPLTFCSSGSSIRKSYTSFESLWPADFDYLSFGSIPWRCAMTWDIV